MAASAELRQRAVEAHASLERASTVYRAAARLYLIAELLEILANNPEIASLHLSAQYEYDDEGGYFRWLSGSVSLEPNAVEGDDLDDSWTEGLDVEQEVILDLFRIEDVGEATLTRAQLEMLAGKGTDGDRAQ